MDKFKCETPTWQDMQDLAVLTTNKIKQSNFHPDIIIGLSRGGLVPARMFCDLLHVKNCFTIKVDHWGLTATKDGKAKLTQELNVDLTNKNVLIVDDITDTGQSMMLAKEHIKEKNPAKVQTATLMHLDNSKFLPDFFGAEKPWAWIVFPWNYKEDLVNMIKKINDKPKTIEETIDLMKQNYGLSIDVVEAEDALSHIEYLEKQA